VGDAYFHESAGNPGGTRLLVGRHVTISTPVEKESNRVWRRDGRVGLDIQVVGRSSDVRKCFFYAYVYFGGFVLRGSGCAIIRNVSGWRDIQIKTRMFR
jgi:hypothetical protein